MVDFDTATATAHIDAPIAQHMLWHFGLGGTQPGSFVTTLLQAIALADPPNRSRLAMGFPGYVAAFDLVMNNEIGLLQKIAEGRR